MSHAFRPTVRELEGRRLPSAVAVAPGDYGGDGRSDPAVYDATTARFEIVAADDSTTVVPFGNPTHVNVPVAGNYDGDGKTDVAIYDETDARFYIAQPDGTTKVVPFGNPAHVNIPIVGDYDGDGKTDVAIYDETAARFYIARPDGTTRVVPFGNPAHVNFPVAGNYDGGGKTDIAIYDQTAARFYIAFPDGRTAIGPFGDPAHVNVPLAGDFDGDGTTDLAVYDQTAARFYVLLSSGGSLSAPLGSPTADDVPVAGDFDGVGATAFALYDRDTSTLSWLAQDGVEVDQPLGATADDNSPVQQSFPAALRSVLPAPGSVPDPGQWLAAQDIIASLAAQGTSQVVFLGDSITAGWPSSAAWTGQVAPLGALDAGFISDQTQNLLWRVEQGDVSGHPRVAVVLIGINNLAHHQAPPEVAAGVAADIAAIHAASPQTIVLLLGVLPAKDETDQVAQLDALLAKLHNGRDVWYLDLSSLLLRRDGSLDGSRFLDGLHPNVAGYDTLTNPLIGPLRALVALAGGTA